MMIPAGLPPIHHSAHTHSARRVIFSPAIYFNQNNLPINFIIIFHHWFENRAIGGIFVDDVKKIIN
jgi:hypothetical protein